MTESIAIKVSKNLNPAGSRQIALHADRFQVKTDFGCPAEFIQLASIEVEAKKQSGRGSRRCRIATSALGVLFSKKHFDEEFACASPEAGELVH